MKVLVLTPTFFPIVGGAEVGIHEIYRRVAETETVTIATTIPADSTDDGFEALDHTREAMYSISRVPPRTQKTRILKKASAFFAVREISYIRQLKRAGQVDVINLQFVYPHGLVAVAARLMNIPVVLSLVGRSDVLAGLSWWRRLHAELVLRAANAITANSKYYLSGSRWTSSATVVPYGADTPYFAEKDLVSVERQRDKWRRASGDDTFFLLAVQRLADVKRVDVLLEVMGILETAQPGRFKLIVVGTGPERESLEKQADKLPADAVEFAGYVDESDLPEIYASADLFLSHSMVETFGVMFAQAMASGTPPVAADTSCISMVIDSGRTGVVVEPFNPHAFADTIIQLADSPEFLSRMSQTARAAARSEYHWDDIAEAHLGVLRGARHRRP
ncbi:MAG: glycosyltransferase family 4 protein [Microbacterium sp.]|uniref:glycosyltransferase family 4 protein n=1 Tax=Microbacterium sp. TaxID=51671 RepID=UPI001AC296C5|nr:glycosyltransferase family 4 protein [Microbacterium sp.]MBN9177784.1 glycosyltransferase family 4 protein [Microbacterium sp.]